jgi:hypothetical protein
VIEEEDPNECITIICSEHSYKTARTAKKQPHSARTHNSRYDNQNQMSLIDGFSLNRTDQKKKISPFKDEGGMLSSGKNQTSGSKPEEEKRSPSMTDKFAVAYKEQKTSKVHSNLQLKRNMTSSNDLNKQPFNSNQKRMLNIIMDSVTSNQDSRGSFGQETRQTMSFENNKT